MAELIMAILGGAAFAFMLLPILRSAVGEQAEEATDSSGRSAKERREQLLENLADLDTELKMGKLSGSDYERIREAARRELHATGAHTVEESGETEPALEDSARSAARSPASGADNPKHCGRCGASNPPASKFCNECGARFDAA